MESMLIWTLPTYNTQTRSNHRPYERLDGNHEYLGTNTYPKDSRINHCPLY